MHSVSQPAAPSQKLVNMYVSVLSVLAALSALPLVQSTCDSPFPSTYVPDQLPKVPSDLSVPLCKGVKIADASIVTIQQFLTDGDLTSQDLVGCYLERIEKTNK
jgi:hypothetical protein